MYNYQGGAVNKTHSFYAPRSFDNELTNLLKDKRSLVSVVGTRQSGKTSLVLNVTNELQEDERNPQVTAFLDLGVILGYLVEDDKKTPPGWFGSIFRAIADKAVGGIDSEVSEWLANRGSNFGPDAIASFLRELITPHIQAPLNLVFDEIDATKPYHYFTDNFFYGLSKLANERNSINASIILMGISPIGELLKSIASSQITNFVPINTSDFSEQEVIEHWTKPLQLKADTERTVGQAVYAETGGQPYLCSRIFEESYQRQAFSADAVAAIAEKFTTDHKTRKSHEHHFDYHEEQLTLLSSSGAVDALSLFDAICKSPRVYAELDSGQQKAANVILRIGMARQNNEGYVVCKGNIHKRIFDKNWQKRVEGSIGFRPARDIRVHGISINGDDDLPRICVINIGGMINMELGPDALIREPSNLTEYIHGIPELREIAQIIAVPLFSKDSSNVTPDDWTIVAQAVYERRNHTFSGFVITGGTDTLPNIASALAFAFGEGLNFPVVCVGAQVARHVLHGDAKVNLIRACTVATLGKKLPEVVILSNDKVLRAVRTEKVDDNRFEAFSSPTLEPLANIASSISLAKHIRVLPDNKNKSITDQVMIKCDAEFETRIFKLSFYPGMRVEYILPVLQSGNICGLVIETPGIGVLPLSGDFSLLEIFTSAREMNIPVLVLSQHPTKESLGSDYYDAQQVRAAGGLPAPNMSPTAAMCKFMWLLPRVQKFIDQGFLEESGKLDAIEKEMKHDFIGETDTESN